MTILFTDDSADTCLLFALSFRGSGHDTHLAHNGAEAVAAVQEQAFDAIVMDFHMPVMDGAEAIRLIRQLPHGRDVPILMFTGDNDFREEALALGADDVVYKPLLPDDVLSHVHGLQVARQSSAAPQPGPNPNRAVA